METAIVQRDTVSEIVRQFNQIRREVVAGYKLLNRAENSFKERINQYGRVTRDNSYYSFEEDTLQTVLHKMKCQTWQGIIQKLNVRGVMDSTRRAALDKQLESGEGLPDIDTEAILDVIHGMMQQIPEFSRAVICEAFELMRRKSDGYKSTGQAWQIKDKVVLGWMVELGYSTGKLFRLCYRSEDDARTIENAFRLLDGKGPIQTHTAEFAGVLNSSATGEGETEYFRFRAHKNGNLHLWFKRPDLVKIMNETAGGAHVLRSAGVA
jgi:hypothetical protein